MPQHLGQGDLEDEADLDLALTEMIDQLCSDDEHERIQAASAIWDLAPWKNTDEIALMIHTAREDSALPLFGWVQFCLQNWMPISLNWVEATFLWVLWNYRASVQIILHGAKSDRLEEKQSGVTKIRHRIKDMTNRLIENENEEAKNYGYCMKLKVMEIFGEDIKRIQSVYDICPSSVQLNEEMIAILADGYEKIQDYPRAYELYQTLQVRIGEAHYLGCQITLLYKMGRVEEAKSLYGFGSSAWIHGSVLFPEFVYRWTLETDEEIWEVYKMLLPLYRGDRIDDVIKRVIQLASEYVLEWLTKIEASFMSAGSRDEDIYDDEFHPLWCRKLFLLEVAVWMLGHTGSFGPFPEWVGMEYILTLRDLFWEHQETLESSILDSYFSNNNQEWMDVVRDVHGDDQHQKQNASQEEGELWSDDMNYAPQEGADIMEESFVSQRLNNILDFLLDRVENDHGDNQELLDEILEFQGELAGYTTDIPLIDRDDVRFAGDLVRKSLWSLSSADRAQYQSLIEYTRQSYGSSIYQFLFFLSANTSQVDEIALDGLKKDPKLLILSIAITLLSVENPPLSKIRDLLSDTILEGLSESETIFLCRILYRTWFFLELCEFMIEDGEVLGYADCLELFFISLTYLDTDTQEDLYERALGVIGESFGCEDFTEYMEAMRWELPESWEHLTHAEMIHSVLTDKTSEVEADLIPLSALEKPSSHKTSMMFTALRIMDVWEWDRVRWLRAIMSLYPFLDIDKKHALESILSWSFYLGLGDEIRRFLALGQADGLPTGYWKYAHLLLWDEQEQKEWIESIVRDPFLHIIPESFIWWIDKKYPDEIDKATGGNLMLEQKFQLSYITAYSWIQGNDKLKKVAIHFQRLGRYIHFCLNGVSKLDTVSVEKVLKLFDAIDYWNDQVKDKGYIDGENRVWPFERCSDLLIRHISEFRRYLDLTWDEQTDWDIAGDEASDDLLNLIESLESITARFDPNSITYIRLSSVTRDLKREWWISPSHWEQSDGVCSHWDFPSQAFS